jgi:hypothetical protein
LRLLRGEMLAEREPTSELWLEITTSGMMSSLKNCSTRIFSESDFVKTIFYEARSSFWTFALESLGPWQYANRYLLLSFIFCRCKFFSWTICSRRALISLSLTIRSAPFMCVVLKPLSPKRTEFSFFLLSQT